MRLNAAMADGADLSADPELRGEIARFSESTVSDKQELFWQRHLFSFDLGAIARTALGFLRA